MSASSTPVLGRLTSMQTLSAKPLKLETRLQAFETFSQNNGCILQPLDWSTSYLPTTLSKIADTIAQNSSHWRNTTLSMIMAFLSITRVQLLS